MTILETPPWGDKEVREFIYDFVVTFKGQIRDKDVRGTKAFLKISQRIFWGLRVLLTSERLQKKQKTENF